MLKRILVILFVCLSMPVFAGELENALKTKNYVFLYLYTKNCGYCAKFNPKYEKVSKIYNKQYAFVKVDADSGYGYSLANRFRAVYVPYVVLIKSKTKQAVQISSGCLLDTACLDKKLTDFTK